MHLTRESFNASLLSKDDELKELNRKYLGELQDLKKVIAGKKDSFDVALSAKGSILKKAKEFIKGMEEEDVRETRLCLIENKALEKEIELLKQK